MYTALIRIQQQRKPCNRLNVSRFRFILNQFKFMGHHRPKLLLVRQMQGPTRILTQAELTHPQTQNRPSLLHQEDYRIYQQNIDLDAFFGEEQKYDKVSDVCLLNDHFILVKMPPKPKELSKPVATTVPVPKKSKLPRCFKCSRSSRISPIMEDNEAMQQPDTSTKLPSWSVRDQDEVEVFDSSTRLKVARHRKDRQTTSPVIIDQPLPSPLKFDAIQPTNRAINRAPVHWFLWPFWRRDTSKSKPQLAAVHKTYFVNWAKPPETLWHGYGVDTGEAAVRNYELRRVRSATF